ncbi:glutamyl aminopeptidase-like [Anneissia japonica]|uniref:glutamyl aminopeptidase-like n=1 Tax=Anneissia japonica TaxID=1529436 RepID=UPI001425943B|nr:glutamyl aminopeptidase-like [Anneissia japonica]
MDGCWVFVCFLATISLSVEGAEVWENLRLPSIIKPNHYDLTLHPNLTTDTFTGVVDIDVTVTEPTDTFLVHIKELTIKNPKVMLKETSAEQAISKDFSYEDNEFYVIITTSEVAPGDYLLHYEFSGSLVGSIVGFYKSTYYNKDGKLMSMATSKFEPTDARRAFPCFDEPNLKANYTTTLVHTDEYFALSNMDVDTKETIDGLIYTKFNPSVKMSTYLACFIVCNFSSVEGQTARGVPFKVYAPHDSIYQADYALSIGINVTDYYEDYFDIPYPLPKLDMIAIPDFVSGAMEHWGLITYRETNLLYDEQESSEGNKQRVAAVIAHELAHQWFGNIVTMDWWDDLWLNEGFASFLEYSGVNHAEPDWQMLDQFVTEDMYYVMGLDQIVTSHPIIIEVNHPDEINEIFDSISYSKGASVLRMLNNIMGEEDFRKGLTVSDVDIKGLMDTWTLQMGFPVVKLSRKNSDTLSAEQEWFLVDPAANKSQAEFDSPFNYKWNIYLDYKFPGESDKVQLMETNDNAVDIFPPTDFQWVIANLNQTGYYRVNYDQTTWDNLIDELIKNHEVIPIADRSGLIDDSFNLAKAGQIDYFIPLNMTKYFIKETEYIPWDTAYSNLNWISEILRYRPVFADWRKYIQRQVKPLLDSLTWDDAGTTHLESYLRSDIIGLSCSHGDPDCLREAETKFQDYLNGVRTSPNVRSLIYRYGMENAGGQAEWDMMWTQYVTATVSQERTRLLYGLARTRQVWLLCRYLTYAMNETKVRSQDFFTVVNYIADNPVGNPLVWDWVRANWEKLVERFGISSRSLGRLVPSICEFYATEFKLQQMKDFFNAYPDAGAGERGRKQALEKVQTNIDWLKVNEKKIEMWLADNM